MPAHVHREAVDRTNRRLDTMTREQAQDILFDAVSSGTVGYTPPLYSMGAGLFHYRGDSCRTNGMLTIPMAERVLADKKAKRHD